MGIKAVKIGSLTSNINSPEEVEFLKQECEDEFNARAKREDADSYEPSRLDPDKIDWGREMYYCYTKARRHKRGTEDEMRFEINAMRNLLDLIHVIQIRQFKPGRSIAFIIFDPVMREIFAAPFRDRIVHHFLFYNCAWWWERRFIDDSYSCRKEKGTWYGIWRLYEYMRRVSNDFTKEAYVIKMDIQGYFMSLSREKLYERVVWGLDHQFPNGGVRYEVLRYLWKEVIFDDPVDRVKIRGNPSDWRELPKKKSLLWQPFGMGIVIGNLTSQLLSNIFLDQLDRYVKLELGYKCYGRYVDDFYIVVPKEKYEQALRDVTKIREYLKTLGLTMHPKKLYVQPVSRGVDFLGVRIYPHHIVPGKRFKKNFRRVARRYGLEGVDDERKMNAAMTSYLGALTHMSGKKFACEVFERNGWKYRW